jgi:hypothetical protein
VKRRGKWRGDGRGIKKMMRRGGEWGNKEEEKERIDEIGHIQDRWQFSRQWM